MGERPWSPSLGGRCSSRQSRGQSRRRGRRRLGRHAGGAVPLRRRCGRRRCWRGRSRRECDNTSHPGPARTLQNIRSGSSPTRCPPLGSWGPWLRSCYSRASRIAGGRAGCSMITRPGGSCRVLCCARSAHCTGTMWPPACWPSLRRRRAARRQNDPARKAALRGGRRDAPSPSGFARPPRPRNSMSPWQRRWTGRRQGRPPLATLGLQTCCWRTKHGAASGSGQSAQIPSGCSSPRSMTGRHGSLRRQSRWMRPRWRGVCPKHARPTRRRRRCE
mmetsp:Transcript_20072/g.63897  ORF Transcript_20072/g.63897 Transcript_20072/m.63897 type:complete len:275 (-) Transcript_20072:23-847(-)